MNDSDIEMKHSIKCQCNMVFLSMAKYLDHKKITNHKKVSHIVKINEELKEIK